MERQATYMTKGDPEKPFLCATASRVILFMASHIIRLCGETGMICCAHGYFRVISPKITIKKISLIFRKLHRECIRRLTRTSSGFFDWHRSFPYGEFQADQCAGTRDAVDHQLCANLPGSQLHIGKPHTTGGFF